MVESLHIITLLSRNIEKRLSLEYHVPLVYQLKYNMLNFCFVIQRILLRVKQIKLSWNSGYEF